MKTIDLENHFATEAWEHALRTNPGYPRFENDPSTGATRVHRGPGESEIFGYLPILLDIGAGRLRAMDEARIDVAVLSLGAPGVEPFEPALGTRLARECNDRLAQAVATHPDRLQGFACLAPKDVDAAVVELERCVKELGLHGWNTHSNFGDSYLDERRFWPILAKAEELQIPIYLHPTVPCIPDFKVYGLTLAGPTFGFTVDAAFAFMRLIVSGAFDAFPRLTVILGHYGEALPFLIERVDRRYKRGHAAGALTAAPETKHAPSHYLKNNLFVTTSGNYAPAAFRCAKDALGIDHVLLGTDYPFETMPECMSFLAEQPLEESERKMLMEENAVRLGFGK
jgi:predicted TIM-barrel fold metal-dependent hydrolase